MDEAPASGGTATLTIPSDSSARIAFVGGDEVELAADLERGDGVGLQQAGDAEQGLEIARTQAPELIFLDIVLPGMLHAKIKRAGIASARFVEQRIRGGDSLMHFPAAAADDAVDDIVCAEDLRQHGSTLISGKLMPYS